MRRTPKNEMVEDIAEYAQFDWDQYVWWHDPTVQFPGDIKLTWLIENLLLAVGANVKNLH